MLLGLRTVIYQVKDIIKAKAWYSSLLGMPPYFDEPYYVGYNVNGYELGLQPNEEGMYFGSSTKAYWGVKDARVYFEFLIQQGSIPNEPIMDVGGGILIGSVVDPCGNLFGVIENPHSKKLPFDAEVTS